MALMASIKYYVQANAREGSKLLERSDSGASLNSLAALNSATRSSTATGDIQESPDQALDSVLRRTLSQERLFRKNQAPTEVALITEDVNVFAKKCADLIQYSKGSSMTPRGIMSQFFDIMEL